MDIKFRKIIYNFPHIHMLCKYIVGINDKLFYIKFDKKNCHSQKISALKDTKKGKRCFIVGNGPSLTINDLELIKDEDCFAANLIYKLFDKTDWRPKYYFIQDRYADTGNDLDTLDIEYLFVGNYYWRTRELNNPKAICTNNVRNFNKKNVAFSNDISKKIIDYHTVTYSMIQAAIYFGYDEIYLIGMDHSYTLTYDKTGKVIRDKSVKSHCFEDSHPEKVIANIEGMNKAYIAARDYANKNSVKIYNSTRGGKLEWFPRKELEKAIEV